MPQAKWDELSPESRGRLVEMLTLWRDGFREQYLGTLPIADRRRLEAMEDFAPEDWEQAGREMTLEP